MNNLNPIKLLLYHLPIYINLISPNYAFAQTSSFDYKGHVKYQSLIRDYPSDSFYQLLIDDPAWDNNLDFRFNIATTQSSWKLNADYQLFTKSGDSITLYRQTPQHFLGRNLVTNDDSRILDLTHTISNNNHAVSTHRLDRLFATYTSDKTVLRIGRQAVSWGNGLIYNPMDFFNPFDPAAVDKEYKTGDDMLYTQYLFNNGNDFQVVWVSRRDTNGDIDNNSSSSAIKYHAFMNDYEFDFLIAEHFSQHIIGFGSVFNIGGSVWRGDIIITDTHSTQTNNKDTVSSAVINASYSWIALGKNINASIEYYYNGFGINNKDYTANNLSQHTELLQRLQRGELFTLASRYLSATATIEIKPLWIFAPTLFSNLDDHSTLLQLLSQHDIKQNFQLTLALNIPIGGNNTEFGGIESTIPQRPFSTGPALFLQLGGYF